MLRLSSDSTCRTVSAVHPGVTGDKGISRTEVHCASFLQNGAVMGDDYNAIK